MKENYFDYNKSDSQGTNVEYIDVSKFDIEAYQAYENQLAERNKEFWRKKSGVAVYRRFRVPGVFSYGCKHIDYSFGLQLAALKESMRYKSDIANFLEPWYGIGTIASAFGIEYIWPENQAPALVHRFKTIKDALEHGVTPVENTEIGKFTLEMIEYFLEKTSGKIPLSFSDIQSPLNTASYIIDINRLFLEMFDDPESYNKLLEKITNLTIDFAYKQKELIGNALVYPGHGFASSRLFNGIGISDDNILMISGDMYEEFEVPVREELGNKFGGTAFHSCGNWAQKISSVKKIINLVMVDGAFSAETDPSPNDGAIFRDLFTDTGIVVNARLVGNEDTVIENVKKLWRPGMKLIITTYCNTPDEQERVYERIHEICGC